MEKYNSHLTAFVIGLLLVFLANALTGCAKFRAAEALRNVPTPVPAPVTCPPPPPIKKIQCYDGHKLVLEAYVTSVLELKLAKGCGLKCKVVD